MKISLLTDGIFPYVIGGMQKHSYYLAKYFAQKGIYVDLYHTNQSKLDISKLDLFSEEEKKFITSFVISFPKPGKLPGHYIKSSYKYSEAIFNVFKENSSTDFIYAKGFSAWKLLEEKNKGFKCAPVGVNFHGYEMFQKQPNFKSSLAAKFLLQKPVLFNVNKADYVFSYGGKIDDIIKSIGVHEKKLISIPTGIDRSWLVNESAITTNKPTKFLFVGRFERRKGVEELNKALLLLKSNTDFEFHFIGPIPEKSMIKLSQVYYHNAISDVEIMKSKVKEMDVLVCPSHSEGMPNVIMESMASGLAIIATNVGAISLMVDESNGILLNTSNPTEIATAIKSLAKLDKDLLQIKKQASVKKVESSFLWDLVISQTINKIKVHCHS